MGREPVDDYAGHQLGILAWFTGAPLSEPALREEVAGCRVFTEHGPTWEADSVHHVDDRQDDSCDHRRQQIEGKDDEESGEAEAKSIYDRADSGLCWQAGNARNDNVIRLQVDTEGYDLDHDLKTRIEDRIGGLDEYMDSLDRGHVTVSWEGGTNEQTRIRAQVWGPGHRFEASDTDWKATTAVDQASHKLEAQIRRQHGKEISERDRR